MPLLVNTFRGIAENMRGLPGSWGLREHSVQVVLTTWPNARIRIGEKSEEFSSLLVHGQNPKVSFPSQFEVAQGMMNVGQILIGPLTPQVFSDAGLVEAGTLRELVKRDAISIGDLFHIVVTGPQHPTGARYRVENINNDKPLRITVKCSAVAGNG